MSEEEIGKVNHYFNKIGVAIIDVTKGSIRIGDVLHIKGSTTDFNQNVDSMQLDKQVFEEVKAGQSIGIKVDEKVRDGDVVFKVTD